MKIKDVCVSKDIIKKVKNNPSTKEAETGGSQVQGQVTWGIYLRPYFKNNQSKKDRWYISSSRAPTFKTPVPPPPPQKNEKD
jgi:hypothetical protein